MNTGLVASVTSRITQPASQYELSESHLVPIFLTWKSWLKTVSPLARGDCAAGQSLKPVSEAMTGAAGLVMSRMSTSAISWLSAIITYALPVAGGFAPGTYQAKELCTEWTPLMFGEIAGVESPTPPASLTGADGVVTFHSDTPPSNGWLESHGSLLWTSRSPLKNGVAMWITWTPSPTKLFACAGMKPALVGADGSLILTTWTPVPCAPGRPAHSGLKAPR